MYIIYVDCRLYIFFYKKSLIIKEYCLYLRLRVLVFFVYIFCNVRCCSFVDERLKWEKLVLVKLVFVN